MCVRARMRLGVYKLERIWVSPATLWDSDITLSFFSLKASSLSTEIITDCCKIFMLHVLYTMG